MYNSSGLFIDNSPIINENSNTKQFNSTNFEKKYNNISVNGLNLNNLDKIYMKENNLYRNTIIVKMKNLPNFLLCDFDILFITDKKNINLAMNKKYKFKISSNFYKINKLNTIYKLLLKKVNNDICSLIIKEFIISKKRELKNLKYMKNLNIKIDSEIAYIKNLKSFTLLFKYKELNQCINTNTNFEKKCINDLTSKNYNYNNLNDIILRDTINLIINENFTKLLNNRDYFDISDIFNLKDNIFEFIHFGQIN